MYAVDTIVQHIIKIKIKIPNYSGKKTTAKVCISLLHRNLYCLAILAKTSETSESELEALQYLTAMQLANRELHFLSIV